MISDGELVLRRPAACDAGWIAQACLDPDIRRWLPLLPQPYRLEDAQGWIGEAERNRCADLVHTFVIERSGVPVGFVDVKRRHEDVGEIGYWMASEARGAGVMTRVVRVVTPWAFERMALARLQIAVDPGNIPSRRVAEKAGYRTEGLLRAWYLTPAGRLDTVMLSRLPGDHG